MTSTTPISTTVDALRRRLQTVQPHLAPHIPNELDVGPLLAALAIAARDDHTAASLWLLGTAVAGGYPTPTEIIATRRALDLARPGEELGAILSGIAHTASTVRNPDISITIIENGTLVDVDFCARNPHNTGIQRVVRNTMPHWQDRPGVQLAAWSDDATGYRALSPQQQALVLDYQSGASAPTDSAPDELLVPWRSRIVLPEVPARHLLERQSTLAQHSGSTVSLIGYDAIPIVSADTVVDDESDRFAHYLTVVKHSHRVACISTTTAEEFRGFVDALPAQGLTGPQISAIDLPVDLPTTSEEPAQQADPSQQAEPTRDRPLVLMVGSIEPRKNQHAVLSAARTLWAEGLAFELYVIGGGHSWYLNEFDRTVQHLRKEGHSVRVGRGITDRELAAAYRDAHVVVFPSVQEGYGLPVAEALATGTPVITTRYGSTAAIATGGGCLLVDPRSDSDITDALRRILTDNNLHSDLVAQTRNRRDTSWTDYADALWNDIGGGA